MPDVASSTSIAPQRPSTATRSPSTSTHTRSPSPRPPMTASQPTSAARTCAYGRSSASCTVSNANGRRPGIAKSCRCPREPSLEVCRTCSAGARRKQRRPPSALAARWPAFVTERQSRCRSAPSSAHCSTASSTASEPNRGQSETLDEARYEALVFHVAGCEDCWALWDARRRSLRARCHAIVLLPLDALSAAGHALADRLAAAAVGAHSATQALLGRLGLAAPAPPRSEAAPPRSAARPPRSASASSARPPPAARSPACCPLLHERTPKTQDATAAKPKKAIAPAQTQTQTSALRNAAPTTPSPVRSAAPITARRTGPQARTATTPGACRTGRSTRGARCAQPVDADAPLHAVDRPVDAVAPTASSPSSAPSRRPSAQRRATDRTAYRETLDAERHDRMGETHEGTPTAREAGNGAITVTALLSLAVIGALPGSA